MDEMETLDCQGWKFLCSGEKMPSGLFQAAVRCRMPPDDRIRTLVLDEEKHGTARQALERAKELAVKWAGERDGGPRGDA